MRIIHVHNSEEIVAAMSPPRDVWLKLHGGVYGGGLSFTDVQRVWWTAYDAADRPIFTDCPWVLKVEGGSDLWLSGLVGQDWTHYGLLLRPGPTAPWTTQVRNVRLTDCAMGPRPEGADGTGTAFELVHIDGVVLDRCGAEDWGEHGCGITMNGCRGGVIRDCTCRTQRDTTAAMLIKSGSADIDVEGGRFESGGDYAVTIGGLTAPEIGRPESEGWEAQRVHIARAYINAKRTAFPLYQAMGVELQDITYGPDVIDAYKGVIRNWGKVMRPSSVTVG